MLTKCRLKILNVLACFIKKQPYYKPELRQGKPYTKKLTIKSSFKGNSVFGKTGLKDMVIVNTGTRQPTNDLSFPKDNKNSFHPTQKPVALLEYLIKTYTKEKEVVLDFTMGSGSTGVACVNTNRKFIGIEKDKKYFKIASERINSSGVN